MGWLDERRTRKKAEMDSMMQQASAQLLTNPDTPVELLAKAVREYPEDRRFVAANPAAPINLLETLAKMGDPAIDASLARNPAWTRRAGA
jgi:hypothetical protein